MRSRLRDGFPATGRERAIYVNAAILALYGNLAGPLARIVAENGVKVPFWGQFEKGYTALLGIEGLDAPPATDLLAVARHGTIQYVHAYSINNSQTWVELPPTLAAHITVPGLPVGTTVLVRWRTLLDGVYGDWSPSLPYQVT